MEEAISTYSTKMASTNDWTRMTGKLCETGQDQQSRMEGLDKRIELL